MLLHSSHTHAQRKEVFRCGDEKGFPVGTSEAYVGGPGGFHGDVCDLFPFLIENRDPFAGQIDIPFVVDGHAVGSHGGKEGPATQAAVGGDPVAVSFPVANISHIEGFPVGRADNAIGLFQVSGYPDGDLASRGQKVYMLSVKLRGFIPARPPGTGIERVGEIDSGTGIERVGEIDSSAGTDPEVVGAVEAFAFITADEDGAFS